MSAVAEHVRRSGLNRSLHVGSHLDFEMALCHSHSYPFAFGMFGHSIHDSRIASHRASHRHGVATAALGAAVRRQLAESFCFQVADFLQFGGRLNQPVICLFRRCRFYLARPLCSLLCVYVLLRFIAIYSELRSNAAWLRLFVLSAYYLPVVHLLIC